MKINLEIIFFITFVLLIIFSSCTTESFENLGAITNNIDALKSYHDKIKANNTTMPNGDLIAMGSVTSNGSELTPIGSVVPFVGNIPDGWLPCDGREVDGNAFPKLRAIMGRVPDLRGRVIVGAGQGGGLTNRDIGAVGGAETVTLTEAQIPPHSHGMTDPGNHTHAYLASHDHKRCDGGKYGVMTGRPVVETSAVGNHNHSINPVGGSQPHNNMMAFMAIGYMIRAR